MNKSKDIFIKNKGADKPCAFCRRTIYHGELCAYIKTLRGVNYACVECTKKFIKVYEDDEVDL